MEVLGRWRLKQLRQREPPRRRLPTGRAPPRRRSRTSPRSPCLLTWPRSTDADRPSPPGSLRCPGRSVGKLPKYSTLRAYSQRTSAVAVHSQDPFQPTTVARPVHSPSVQAAPSSRFDMSCTLPLRPADGGDPRRFLPLEVADSWRSGYCRRRGSRTRNSPPPESKTKRGEHLEPVVVAHQGLAPRTWIGPKGSWLRTSNHGDDLTQWPLGAVPAGTSGDRTSTQRTSSSRLTLSDTSLPLKVIEAGRSTSAKRDALPSR